VPVGSLIAIVRPSRPHDRLLFHAARLRARAPEAQSGRRAGEAGLDLVQKLVTEWG